MNFFFFYFGHTIATERVTEKNNNNMAAEPPKKKRRLEKSSSAAELPSETWYSIETYLKPSEVLQLSRSTRGAAQRLQETRELCGDLKNCGPHRLATLWTLWTRLRFELHTVIGAHCFVCCFSNFHTHCRPVEPEACPLLTPHSEVPPRLDFFGGQFRAKRAQT